MKLFFCFFSHVGLVNTGEKGGKVMGIKSADLIPTF